MGTYPIFLELGGSRVLLVGGGRVAHEKLHKLVEAGAEVMLVAPELVPQVRAYVDDGRVRHLERAFEAGDTEGYDLVFVATDDGAVNRSVADEARANGILVNAADDIANCDFILPGSVRRGPITLAASTGGSSPAMARWLRERLTEFLSDEVVALGELLAEVRVRARERDHACAARCSRRRTPPPLLCAECPNRIPPDRWQEAIDDTLLGLLRDGQTAEARALLVERMGITDELVPAAWWEPAPA